jgi:hypothetical protein
MSLKALRLAVVASITAALLAPAAIEAQRPGPPARSAYTDRARDRDISYSRDRDRDRDRTSSRRGGDQQPRTERCDDGDGVGSLLGAIAGGLLASSSGNRHSGRPAGTLIAERGCD